MEKILKKIIMKYFIYKIQEDWRVELKKIPEDRLKKWMDEDLFIKMGQAADALVTSFVEEASTTWDNEMWMDINDFVNDYSDELEKLQEEKDAMEDEDYWDTEDDEKPGPMDGRPLVEDEEIPSMYCPDHDPECNCDHEGIHKFDTGCNTGCKKSDHATCIAHVPEENPLVTNDDNDVPEEDELTDKMMICNEAGDECLNDAFICDHAERHEYGPGCNTGCGFTKEHYKCELADDIPEEIAQTGGI